MARQGRKNSLSDGQRAARRELRQVAAEHPDLIQLVGDATLTEAGHLEVVVRLSMAGVHVVEGGLPVGEDSEEVTLHVPARFPWWPPSATINHDRFLGRAHVLQGRLLCVYLDPDREWHPYHGMRGCLNRLREWFVDGAAGKFDPNTALFHPVGGVLHHTPGTPTVVVRVPLSTAGGAFRRAALKIRTPHRIDLLGWEPRAAADHYALVMVLTEQLLYGAGTTVRELLLRIAAAGHGTPDSLAALLAHTAARNAIGTPLYVIIAVPHRTRQGGHHLLAGRLPATLADVLRVAATRQGPALRVNSTAFPAELSVEWCRVSDERPTMITRRDASRPTSRFVGTTVEIWGCGGLGSWVAEFIARAGAAQIVLRDPSAVQGGLLVRQNYLENDIGANKAERLAERLRQINDDLTVQFHPEGAPPSDGLLLPACDILIDATVTNGIGVYLDHACQQTLETPRPLLAQVATDLRTATLGLLTVAIPSCPDGPRELDRQAGELALADVHLERFHPFWQQPIEGDEVLPARGCSVPTFHGSAADVAATAASLISLLGTHIGSTVSGTHLTALPHSPGTGPNHHFIPDKQIG